MDNLTVDYLLDGRIKFYQPVSGFRVAIDSIFLAAAVQAQPGESVLDVGSGVGAASLCLASRLENIKVLGLERQRTYVRLGYDNVMLNKFNGRVEFLSGDLQTPPPRLAAGTFAHVMSNPPYYAHNHRPSENEDKAAANHLMDVDMQNWLRFSLLMLRPKGTLTLILTVDRLDEMLSLLYGKIGRIKIYPLWAGPHKEAKRFIIQGVKGIQGPARILPGMVLHTYTGQYTEEANNILRNGKGIEW
ncbi:MAG: methyltransferase [Alphaproteobacteria bacterium]|nr:methyltransferase [Alphaproteobacteria bacterium]